METGPEIIILLITFVINLGLALLVYFKDRKNRINITFSLLIFCVAVWNFTNLMSYITIDNDALFWTKMAILAPLFIPAVVLYFSLIYPEKKKLTWWHFLLIFGPGLVMLPFVPTSFNIVELSPGSTGVHFVPGSLYIFFTIYFILYMGLGLINIYRSIRKSKGLIRRQLTYIFIGVLLAAAVGIITNAVLPLIWSSQYNVYGTPFSIIFSICVAYALVRYRLMDIKVILRKGLAYILVLIFVLALFSYLILYIGKTSEDLLNLSTQITTLFTVLVIAIAFHPLKNLVQKLIDKIFLKEKYKFYKQELDEVSQEIRKTAKVDDLLKKVAERMTPTLNVDKVCFYVFNKKDRIYEYVYPDRKSRRDFNKQDPLITYFDKHRKILIREEIPYLSKSLSAEDRELLRVIDKRLTKHEVEMVVPLGLEDIVGFMLIGPKLSKKVFTDSDLEFLKDLERPFSWALFNALFYIESMEGFYKAEGKIID